MDTLNTGDRFPTMSADAVDGSHFTLPDDVEDIYSVIIFYRGHW
ncbi:MAG TPA: hypothetical protein VJ925_11265 [Longimicrobiales bacterium]|nr:hypothetical protein [Longimicrobiales bacterium]